MPKKSRTLDLALPPRDGGVPSYRWLYAALRREILANRLPAGTQLPATRDLALQYGLSRGTIVTAFEMLRSEGYLDAAVGRGTFVSATLPDALLEPRSAPGTAEETVAKVTRPLSDYARRLAPRVAFEALPARAFRPSMTALDLFPTDLWGKIAATRLRHISIAELRGCSPLGYQPLREAIADYLNVSRGVNCSAEQVVIVSGVQDALNLAAHLLVNPGDRVCVESPGYHGASTVFESYGAKIVPLHLDDEGAQVQEHLMRDARLIYVTPAHQYPLGITMSLRRRLELLDCAHRTGSLIFEDDYDSEFRYVGRPISALQGLDNGQSVLFAGSFSKVLFPSLRLGYLVVPLDLITYFENAKAAETGQAPLLDQAILCDFITGGHFVRHVKQMRDVYAERLSILMECARERLDGLLEVSPIQAGLQTVGWLRTGIDSESAAYAAAQRQIDVVPLTVRQGAVDRHALYLGFAALNPNEIRDGIATLEMSLTHQNTSIP